MTRVLCAVAIIVGAAASSASAHHSYAAYHRDQVVEIEGVIEDFAWVAPHALLKVRTDTSRLVTVEWRAPVALQRVGIERDTLEIGQRIIVAGNPHRDFDANGVLNFKSVRRLADGWTWPAP